MFKPIEKPEPIIVEKIVEKGFDRYVYNPNEIVPTEQAKSITSDKTILLDNTKSFTDIIPAQSFAIYVESGNLTSEDTEIPF